MKLLSLLASLALFALPGVLAAAPARNPTQAPGRQTIGITAVEATTSVRTALAKSGHADSLNRVLESLDGQLIDAINGSRKFQVVARSDFEKILREGGFAQESGNVNPNDPVAAKMFMSAGVKYILVMTLDDFQDYVETATFEGLGKKATKRVIRMSAVAKIYDSTTGKLLESANFQLSNKDIAEKVNYVRSEGDLSDRLLVDLSRMMSERVANRVVDVIFPAKVLAKTGEQVTINRGDGTGIAVGQVWAVYATGNELVDPDTGEVLGVEEVQVGKARITAVQPKISQAALTEDLGVQSGHILRPMPPAAEAK